MTAALHFDDVSKSYRAGRFWRRTTVPALDSVSFEIEAGEIFGFLGPNGAGKTTALHLLMGFIFPDRGRGGVFGRPFGDAHARRRIGFLPENLAFYRYLTPVQLLDYFGQLNDVTPAELKARIPPLLARVKLSEAAHRRIGGFSRGMLQRLGIAQVLIHDPDLLVLDEPTSGLDPLGRRLVRELLLELKGQGKTVFLSSHLLSEIEMVCDRVGVLDRGRLRRIGSVREMLEGSAQVEITVRGASPTWLESLQAQGAQVSEQDRLHRIVLDRSQQRAAIERLWGQGGELLSLVPARSTIEDFFIEVVEEAETPPGESS
jgi:ABC-2 type transport system ATP-binding protein